MPGATCPYATLGLAPGADRLAIEAAYRQLIKQYHPDRSGGDAARAAEINRAYHELRRQEPRPLQPQPRRARRHVRATHRSRRRSRSRRFVWFAAIGSAAAVLLTQTSRWDADAEWPQWGNPPGQIAASTVPPAHWHRSLQAPLSDEPIGEAVRQAARMVEAGDDVEALAEQSRGCHRAMRSQPSLAQLDRCAAFDDTVSTLIDRDVLRDTGPFSASAVTARQMTAASLLSRDYLEIEARLDRVRNRVEWILAPPPPEPVPQAESEQAAASQPEAATEVAEEIAP